MDINAFLPFVSAAIMVVFTVLVFRRFFEKGAKAYHLLIWGVGLVFYLLGGLMEALHTAFGWNALVFRLWYLFGAILVAAWLGQGTVELLVRRRVFGRVRFSHILVLVLAAASVYAAIRVFTAHLEPVMLADEVQAIGADAGFDDEAVLAAAAGALSGTALDDGEVSSRRMSPLTKAVIDEAEREGVAVTVPGAIEAEMLPDLTADVGGQTVALQADGTRLDVSIDGQHAGWLILPVGSEMHGHAIVSGGTRVLTPFFNVYGLFTLVGGAIYSAWIFLRKRIMPNRVMGNVLIAAGALMPGIGGLLSRFGLRGYLYLGELLGAILMFAGFMLATKRPVVEESPVQEAAVAAR